MLLGNNSGGGVEMYTVQQWNQTGLKDACLPAVIKWRQDALDSDIKWPDRRGDKTITQYLVEEGISKEDYLNPAWGGNLEYIAMERGVEASVLGYHYYLRFSGNPMPFSLTRAPIVDTTDEIRWEALA